MENNEFEKASLFRRAFNLLKFAPHVSWENFFIVFFGAIAATFLGEYLGILNFVIGFDGVLSDSTSYLGGVFFVIVGIIEMYLIRKIPLKLMRINVIIYGLIVGLALALGILAHWSFTALSICILFWILFYIYLQLLNDTRSVMGLFGILIFVLTFMCGDGLTIINFPIETVGYYFIFGFLMVIVNSIPMFIIRLLQKDPAKRELLSRLFDKNIEFHEFVMIKERIVDFDNSKRNRSLISIAKEFYIANSNLQTLSKYMDDEEDYLIFLDEIERLLGKVQEAILKGFDKGFEVNIGYIAEYQKTLEYQLEAIPHKNSEQLLLDNTIKNYKKLFEDLNAILANEKVIDTIAPHKRRNNLLTVIKGFNLSNVSLRYSVRSILALLISLIFDTLFIRNSLMMTTLISAFTIKPSASNTNRNIFIRFSATLFGIILGILISLVLKAFLLNAIVSYLVIVCFILFFIFYEDEQLSLIFVMMAFIFLNIDESIFVSIEHFIMTIISMVIIIFITNFVLPSEEDSNIVQLLIKKVKLATEYNEVSLIKDANADKINQEISNNDYEVLRLFSNIEDTYENISEDMKVLTELNSALSDYTSTITGIKRYSKGYDLSEFGKITNEFLDYVLSVLNGEEEIYDTGIQERLSKVVEDITSEDSKINFLKASFINIVNDFVYIQELLSEAEKLNLFELYNQNILEENLSERFTVNNLKYIIKQYRYIFVAARYLYSLSGEDISSFAKKGVDSAQDLYDNSIKKAYDVAGNQIKETISDVSDDFGELKDYAQVSINYGAGESKNQGGSESINQGVSESTKDSKIPNLDDLDVDMEDEYVKRVFDIYQTSYHYMDKIPDSGKDINKLYTSDGKVIEISDKERKEMLKYSKENRKFFNSFVKLAVKSSWKNLNQKEFKTTLDKEKALENRNKSKKVKKVLDINIFR